MTSKPNPGDCLTMNVKRYDLGTEYRGNIGAPAIVGKVNGRFVSYDDYAALFIHNELLALLLQKTRTALHPAGMTHVGNMRADDQPGGDPWPDIWDTLPVGTRLYASLEQEQLSPNDAEPMYYLQDTRSYVGNCPMWWALNGNGYTTRLDEAQRYTFDEAMRQHNCRPSDVPWPCSQIDKLRRPTVDAQHMGCATKQAESIQEDYARHKEQS